MDKINVGITVSLEMSVLLLKGVGGEGGKVLLVPGTMN